MIKSTILLQRLLSISFCIFSNQLAGSQPIDRKALIERHTIVIDRCDTLNSLSVGNGAFAFTVDATGLQTFPEFYSKGIPLGTLSEWGWHSFPNTKNFSLDETLRDYDIHGRPVKYAVQSKTTERIKNAVDYIRQNPHRMQLGNLGLDLKLRNGKTVLPTDIHNIHQELNMWTGEIHSHFTVENQPVDVFTCCHQQRDIISTRIISPLIELGQLKIRLRLPYPTNGWADKGCNWSDSNKHRSMILHSSSNDALIQHKLDTTSYYIDLQWKGKAIIQEKESHYFILTPEKGKIIELSCCFSPTECNSLPDFEQTQQNSAEAWKSFWKSGAAVDFSACTDSRAPELERRVVTSQYLTKIQCAGNFPPQETGLTYNSWYGKPHLEMPWWHAAHFALWGRPQYLERMMQWYFTALPTAVEIAYRQGYEGARWPKMTDHQGRETPSSVGAFLIWQQPHLIYFAEQIYHANKSDEVLKKYKDLVFATAGFMASYAWYDSIRNRYILGPGLICAQERFKPMETFNPTYELAYWQWALSTAQKWRERLHLPRNAKWDDVLNKLSSPTIQDGKYLAAESATDSYTNPTFRTDHPSVLGTFGMIPGSNRMDSTIMKITFNWVWDNWQWRDTWGWDFPMTAMTATRLGMPEKALNALFMNIQTNTYLTNGHNYQDQRLTLYLPGNGGLLNVIALMCAGWEGCSKTNPGFPTDGKWNVKWEGLEKSF